MAGFLTTWQNSGTQSLIGNVASQDKVSARASKVTKIPSGTRYEKSRWFKTAAAMIADPASGQQLYRLCLGAAQREFRQHRVERRLDAADGRVLVGVFGIVIMHQHRGVDLEHQEVA